MAEKEKAEKLVHKFKPFVQFKMGVDPSYVLKMAKQCALIAVDEIIRSHHNLYGVNNKEVKGYREDVKRIKWINWIKYKIWTAVKK